jgi:outer membrane receptor protein involved in Fe transport
MLHPTRLEGALRPWLVLTLTLTLAPAAGAEEPAGEPEETVELAGVEQPVTPEEEPAPTRAAPKVERIIVTATKREESVQDIPIAVSAFTGEDLRSRGVADLRDLQQVSPSLSVYGSNSDSGGGTLRIRGMGTTGNNPGLESAVGLFIDGIYRSRAGHGFNDLVDVERVEVLRGPQGTLFGKNTSAGAVHIITRKPYFEWDGHVTGSYGNMDYWKTTGSVTGPLVDETLAFRLAGSMTEREGYYRSRGSFEKYSDLDRYTLRGQFLFTPAEDFELRLIGDYGEKNESCCPASYRQVGGLTGGIYPLLPNGGTASGSEENDKKVGLNHGPDEDVKDWGVSLEANWELVEGLDLVSISSYREFEAFRQQDIDFSDAFMLLPQGEEELSRTFSEELRLTGSAGPIDWLGGIYAYTEKLDGGGAVRFDMDGDDYWAFLHSAISGGAIVLDPANYVPGTGCDASLPGCGYFENAEQKTEGFAIFTNDTWHITEALDFTGGARFNWENKEGREIVNGASPGTFLNEPWCEMPATVARGLPFFSAFCDNRSFSGERIEQEWTWSTSLSYHWTDDLNTYLSFSRGYKAGGFNLDQQAGNCVPGAGAAMGCPAGFVPDLTVAPEFEPEKANAYEVGVKSTWLNGQLLVNVAGFFTEFKDFQLNTFTGTGFFITNVPKVKSRGAEVEWQYNPIDGLIFTGGVTYADTRYSDNLHGEVPSVLVLAGRRITHAPPWQSSAAILFERQLPISDWTWVANTNMSYRGRHNTGSDLDRPKEQSAYTLWNASLGLRSPDGHWEVTSWIYNLLDRHYNTIAFDSVLQPGSFSTFYGTPRTYGVTVGYNF